jgi:hypothetical protein
MAPHSHRRIELVLRWGSQGYAWVRFGFGMLMYRQHPFISLPVIKT